MRIKGYEKEKVINYSDSNNPFLQMFEDTSWVKCRNGEEHPEPNWCEYLMWNRGKNTDMPALLAYKYYEDEENDRTGKTRNYCRNKKICNGRNEAECRKKGRRRGA